MSRYLTCWMLPSGGADRLLTLVGERANPTCASRARLTECRPFAVYIVHVLLTSATPAAKAMRQSREALKRSAFLRALGAAMRARRVRLKLTIVEVAARLGEPPVAVLRLESGVRNVSVLRLAAAARALEISLPRLVKLAEGRMRRSSRRR
jgi:hypothetical protein